MRPLYDDGASKAQEATRDYVLKLEGGQGAAPLLNVFGGKLTTYRRLSEHALEKIGAAIGDKGSPWTAKSHLPGGDFPVEGYAAEVGRLKAAYPFLSDPHARRLTRRYGTRASVLLGQAQIPRRPRPLLRRRSLRGRGPLSRPARMGDHRRRRAVAAHQEEVYICQGMRCKNWRSTWPRYLRNWRG